MDQLHRLATTALLAIGLAITMAAPASAAATLVAFADDHEAGTIVVRTSERALYLLLDGDRALRYPVGVGTSGRQWAGRTSIEGKFVRPNWAPPAEIRRENPRLPALIAGGSKENPMGEAAMTLAGGPYAIHGTNVPNSIGGFVSHGCIRMLNGDIVDLYGRVRVGTLVVVTR